jgi:hypothetical protein
MKLEIRSNQLFLDGKYACDTSKPQIRGKYKVTFERSMKFGDMMPLLTAPGNNEILICQCRETCNSELKCDHCDSIRVGRRFSGEELLNCRHTFNQLYYNLRHGKNNKEITIEIN